MFVTTGGSAKTRWTESTMARIRKHNSDEGREVVRCKSARTVWTELWWYRWMDQRDWVSDHYRRCWPWSNYCQSTCSETKCKLNVVLLSSVFCLNCTLVSLECFVDVCVKPSVYANNSRVACLCYLNRPRGHFVFQLTLNPNKLVVSLPVLLLYESLTSRAPIVWYYCRFSKVSWRSSSSKLTSCSHNEICWRM